jgi:ABC-2 type transport system permease protein
MLSKTIALSKKELAVNFASPVAFLFIGTFLLICMFLFFWVEGFYSRNITDVRPLFDWMPVLLIFLVAALTMRSWSEERRMGTVEFLMTLPVPTIQLVLGKFLACLALVAIALALTIGLPFSVSFMGNLDFGPVIGAYLAALLLAGAYVSIGLFVSSKTDSQIVSLIVTILLCFLLYLVGANTLTGLVGNFWGEILRLVGSGARFESITSGMLDGRDLYYYISIIGVFLTLNILTLEKLKWSEVSVKPKHTTIKTLTALAIINFVIANFWLERTNFLRLDLTEGNQYTVSQATKDVLSQLQEPLLIRGYFSAKTHPLLAPLVPQVRDLLREYNYYGSGKVRSEFIDPRENPELEQEANQKYNIRSVPFQMSDRYQASLVNSYFDILVQYGDKFEVLSFRDLIEVKLRGEANLDVQLRNLEYDLTRTIKKAMSGFRTTDSLFASLKEPLKFTVYASDSQILPAKLSEFLTQVEVVAGSMSANSNGKFEYTKIDPKADDGKVAEEILQKYGFQPMVANLIDPKQFYFYMLLENSDQSVQIALPENLTVDGARHSIESALKRFSPGFLKTVGLATPPVQSNPMYMQAGLDGRKFDVLREKLEQTHTVKNVELAEGVVPEDIDLLYVLAPEKLGDKDLFAIDQFLMRGGTVVLATAPYAVTRTRENLSVQKHDSGVTEWLKHNGVEFEEKIVMDKLNEPYPVPVRRDLGGFSVQEIKLVNYPPFVDIRDKGLGKHGISSGVQQVTMNWASPLKLNLTSDKKSELLLQSSKNSWLTSQTKVEPDFRMYPNLGFPVEGEQKSYPLASVLSGQFESYFKGKQSPLLTKEDAKDEDNANQKKAKKEDVFTGVIEKSATSARLVIYASNEFLADQTLEVSASSGTERYLNTLQLAQNTADWALEDAALLTIRNRGHFSRTLRPMPEQVKMFWEYGNYIFVLFGLLLVYFYSRAIMAKNKLRYAEYAI